MRYLRDLHRLTGRQATEFEVGVGYAPAHHGELLQGVFEDPSGRLRRGLMTLPLPDRGSRAVFHPSQYHWGVVGTPELAKVRRAAARALREFATHPGTTKGGHIEITSDVPRGIGMGSSTSDVTAAIRAVADYHRVNLSAEDVGRLAVQAECASDSIMVDDRVVLFAHRDGLILETLGTRLPPLVVVGCDTDPGRGVDTLTFRPAEYNDQEIGIFQVLRAAARRAVATGDAALLGRVATTSAKINQRFLPKPHLDALLGLCRSHGGCGIQIAHSGTVAGLMFDAALPDIPARVERCVSRINEMGLVVTCVIGEVPSPTEVKVTAVIGAEPADRDIRVIAG